MDKPWNKLLKKPPASFRAATETDIYYCYRLYLNREPDPEGWEVFMQLVSRNVSLKMLTDYFCYSEEFLFSHQLSRLDSAVETIAPIFRVELEDFSIYVRSVDYAIGGSIARYKTYEPHVTRELRSLLKPGHVFVDVGANIGYFTLLAASIVGPEGKVIAFDPNLDHCALLCLSIRENNFQNIELHTKALSDREQPVTLEANAFTGRVLSAVESAREGAPAETGLYRYNAETVVADKILASENRIAVIKMDIEGGEPVAVRGMRDAIRKHRPAIITEFSPPLLAVTSGTEPEAYLDALREFGYEIFVLEHSGRKSSAPQSNKQIMEQFEEVAISHLDLVAYPR